MAVICNNSRQTATVCNSLPRIGKDEVSGSNPLSSSNQMRLNLEDLDAFLLVFATF